MILKDEFKYLNSFIELDDKREAERCLSLRYFLDSRDKILLIDADSLVWWSCYKLFTYSKSKELIEYYGREGAESVILDFLFERFETSVREMVNHIEEEFNITNIHFFFSRSNDNFRYWLNPNYKANRKGYRSPFIKRLGNLIVDEYLRTNEHQVHFASKLEADNLYNT